ncbi:MAG: Uma2 family endonuclease [Holophagaceae bacterium]|nr:Uma2 family endonuclease [Holophagaceae bacterium]
MNLPQPRHPGYSLEDWQTWDGRWELIDGVAYDMTPAPSLEHQRVSTRLSARVFSALEEAKRGHSGAECEVIAAPVDVYLNGGVVQPDLVIVCDPAKKTPRGIEGAPDLVVEILSPNTAGKDHSTKRWMYESAGIPEYLVVDPEERIGILLRLQNGRYQEASRVEWGSVVALLDGKLPVTLD